MFGNNDQKAQVPSTIEPSLVCTGTVLSNGAEVLRVARLNPVLSSTAVCVAYWPRDESAHSYAVWNLNDSKPDSMYTGEYFHTDYEAQVNWADRLGLT